MAQSVAFFRAANIFDLDYPYEAAVASALTIVDEAIIVVGQSQDRTRDAIYALRDRWPGRVKVREERFVFDRGWQERWWDWCSELTNADWRLWLDLDEVIDPVHAPALRAIMAGPRVRLVRFPFTHLYGSNRWQERGVFLTRNARLGRASAGYRMRNWCSDEQPTAAACAVVVLSRGQERNAHTFRGAGVVEAPGPILHYGWCRSARALARSQAKQRAWYAGGGGLEDGRVPEVEPWRFDMARMRAEGRIVPFEGLHPALPELERWFRAHGPEWAVREREGAREHGP